LKGRTQNLRLGKRKEEREEKKFIESRSLPRRIHASDHHEEDVRELPTP